MFDQDSSCSKQIEDSGSNTSSNYFIKKRSSEECWRCWNFPKNTLKPEVIVQNPKYCTLYPKRVAKKLKELIPIDEECKTVYTKCDLKLEACTHEQLLKVEQILKLYEKTFKKEIKCQAEHIEPIWKLSLRFCLLTESSCKVKHYPEIVSAPTEGRTLCEFHALVKKIHLSNCRLRDLLNHIKTEIDELDSLSRQLDMTIESPFLIGDGGQNRSFAYLRQMISDLYEYFFIKYSELRTWAQLIDVADTAAIEDYIAILEAYQDRDGFMIVKAPKCTCRRAKFLHCLQDHKPC